MPLILLLGLQAAIVPTVPPNFDLAKYRPSASCESSGPYEVVVCGRRHADRNRILPIEGSFEAGPLLAETGVGGNMKLGVVAEPTRLSNGTVSNRMMIRLKVPF